MNARRLLYIGWDAADWQVLHPLIDAGHMPALAQLVETGASGELQAVEPPEPVLRWATLATGKRAYQHGVLRPGQTEAWRAQPLWEILARQGKRSLCVGWPGTHGQAPEGVTLVSDQFPYPAPQPDAKEIPPPIPGAIFPAELEAGLAKLRVNPLEIGPDLISQLVPRFSEVDQTRDPRLSWLRYFLAQDYSYQAALTALMEQQPDWEFAAVHFPALGQICRAFMAFTSPKMAQVTAQDHEIYGGVVAAACPLFDAMLARLVNLAGPECGILLVSANGFRTGDGRPQGRAPMPHWWRSHGVIVVAGPGAAADELIFGAGQLDLVPTALHWLGLPIGQDMEGRALTEALTGTTAATSIATWEPERGASLPNQALDLPSAWNLAQALVDGRRLAEALPLLEKIFRSLPEKAEYGQALYRCQMDLGHLAAAAATLEVLSAAMSSGPGTQLMLAELALANQDPDTARSILQEIRDSGLILSSSAWQGMGLLYLKLGDWPALQHAAHAALELDQKDPVSWRGLGEALIQQRRPVEALDAAMRAISLRYFFPDAHFLRARCLGAMNQLLEAKEAAEMLLKIQPGNPAAIHLLGKIREHAERAGSV